MTIASTAAVFSAVVKDKFLELLPNLVIAEAVGSTETGYNGATVIVKGTKTKPGMPTVRMGPDTVVLDDDYNIVEPGSVSSARWRAAATFRSATTRIRRSAATFVDVGGRRYAVSGDFAIVEADGSMTLLGRGSVCINSGGEKIFRKRSRPRSRRIRRCSARLWSVCPTTGGASASPRSWNRGKVTFPQWSSSMSTAVGTSRATRCRAGSTSSLASSGRRAESPTIPGPSVAPARPSEHRSPTCTTTSANSSGSSSRSSRSATVATSWPR